MAKWRIVCNVGSYSPTKGKEFENGADAKAYCEHLSKHYRNYDIYKNGELVGTGDRYGYYFFKKNKRLTGSVGYAQLMSEKR